MTALDRGAVVVTIIICVAALIAIGLVAWAVYRGTIAEDVERAVADTKRRLADMEDDRDRWKRQANQAAQDLAEYKENK